MFTLARLATFVAVAEELRVRQEFAQGFRNAMAGSLLPVV
jgi:hypothetical protein